MTQDRDLDLFQDLVQENHDQENPRRPLTYMNYADSLCSTWIVTFKRPVPVTSDELETDTEGEIDDRA